jgi:hypothetical protein
MVSIASLCVRSDLQEDPSGREAPFAVVHPRQFHVLHALFSNNASVRAAYETICRFMFAGGMVVEKKAFELTPAIQDVMNSVWILFCRHVLESIFTYGFAVCAVDGRGRPFVWEPTELQIEVRRRSTGEREYRLFRLEHRIMGTGESRRPMQDVLVFERSGPDAQGNLKSLLRSLLQMETFRNLMMACAARAEQRRSNPPIITESLPKDVEAAEMDRDVAAFGDASLINLTEEEKRNMRVALNVGLTPLLWCGDVLCLTTSPAPLPPLGQASGGDGA